MVLSTYLSIFALEVLGLHAQKENTLKKEKKNKTQSAYKRLDEDLKTHIHWK